MVRSRTHSRPQSIHHSKGAPVRVRQESSSGSKKEVGIGEPPTPPVYSILIRCASVFARATQTRIFFDCLMSIPVSCISHMQCIPISRRKRKGKTQRRGSTTNPRLVRLHIRDTWIPRSRLTVQSTTYADGSLSSSYIFSAVIQEVSELKAINPNLSFAC